MTVEEIEFWKFVVSTVAGVVILGLVLYFTLRDK